MIEIERRFLLKFIPEGLSECRKKEIIDIYIPKTSDHPTIRIRKNGDKYEITKKAPSQDDPNYMEEQTIKITKDEFEGLNSIPGKRLEKTRYFYEYENGRIAQVDIFGGDLKGLAMVDIEFDNYESESALKVPEFCLVDMTREDDKFFAGGMLCGKSYSDIEIKLQKYGYTKI